MLSDGPPSFDDVTTSLTCEDSTDVKIFTSSGMIAPASVPQVMTVESFHQSDESPPGAPILAPPPGYVKISEYVPTAASGGQ